MALPQRQAFPIHESVQGKEYTRPGPDGQRVPESGVRQATTPLLWVASMHVQEPRFRFRHISYAPKVAGEGSVGLREVKVLCQDSN
ncbi:hypothetical protein EXIGLDRAFT_426547 [Exidia glandulosa HHB12029]|uniref:Uncharacterized protein n=1 Tax=Exidia glandulosa HHB12029 TaxID=1314781 RepID=A0A165BCM9_EXIGL|nr:hypothetical protein EXIGLDRAFT_426547 [Exidia glandulosa HHB12029]